MNSIITYVAMDTHKKDHKIAAVFPDTGELLEMTVANTAKELTRMVKKLKKKAPGQIRICYEAGVCGFELQRRLESHGCHCDVIAPSLIPTKPGERIKTDRRDAKKLLQLYKADMLTAIAIADQALGRLGKRFRRLMHNGKPSCKAVVAVARELIGFIWAVVTEYERRNAIATT